MASEQTISRIITMIEIAYGKDLRGEAQVLYFQMLQDIGDSVLRAATTQHIAGSKWMPRISELRDAARLIQNRALGIPAPAEAWAEVKRQIAGVGYVGHPEFEDDATARTVEAMGWRYLCHSTDEMADRAHFLRMFGQIQGRREEIRSALPAVNEEIARLAAAMGQSNRLREGDAL